MFKLVIFVAFLSQVLAIKEAIVKLEGGNNILGFVKFTKNPEGCIDVTGQIYQLPAGEHGFHVHQFGDLSNGCLSTGGHFNPQNKSHGGPQADVRHVGDLGNVVADAYGTANINFTDCLIDLKGVHSIIGRGVVVHERADDLGLGNTKDSLTTGNAGGRIACGVIGVLRESSNNSGIKKAMGIMTLVNICTGLFIMTRTRF